MGEWYLFLVAIGFLILATSPMVGNSIFAMISGIVIIVIGGFLYQKQKKG